MFFLKFIFVRFYSKDGYLRVLLDGGPTRVFLETDAEYLEVDLSILKVQFLTVSHVFTAI